MQEAPSNSPRTFLLAGRRSCPPSVLMPRRLSASRCYSNGEGLTCVTYHRSLGGRNHGRQSCLEVSNPILEGSSYRPLTCSGWHLIHAEPANTDTQPGRLCYASRRSNPWTAVDLPSRTVLWYLYFPVTGLPSKLQASEAQLSQNRMHTHPRTRKAPASNTSRLFAAIPFHHGASILRSPSSLPPDSMLPTPAHEGVPPIDPAHGK